MNLPTITALIVALSALLGVGWNIWTGRKTILNKKNVSMFSEAKQIIEQYKVQVAELTVESERCREEIEKLKRKNWQLMRLLARAWNVPMDFVELQLEHEGTEPFNPPYPDDRLKPSRPPQRPRGPTSKPRPPGQS